MFNKFLEISQEKLNIIYENSLILQNIDKIILLFVMLTLLSSTVMNSDSIGFIAIIIMFLSIVKLLTKPSASYKIQNFEFWLLIYFLFVILSLA